MIEVTLVIYFNSNPALTPLYRRDHFSLQKCRKYVILTLIFEKFSGAVALDPHTEEGLRCPSQNASTRGHIDCQVLRAPQYLNPALLKPVVHTFLSKDLVCFLGDPDSLVALQCPQLHTISWCLFGNYFSVFPSQSHLHFLSVISSDVASNQY